MLTRHSFQWADQPQRVDIDRLHIGRSGGRRARAAGDQLRRDPLRFFVHGRRAIGHQRRLTAQRIVDAGAQQRPVRLGNIEMATEIEEGALAHGAAEAFGVHQAMREVGLSVLGPPGLGAPNEHGAHHSGRTLSKANAPARGSARSAGSDGWRKGESVGHSLSGMHGVSVERGNARARPADRRACVAEDDEAVRPDGGHDLARRDRTHRDLKETGRSRRTGRGPPFVRSRVDYDVGCQMSTEGLVYESVVDFAADSPRRGLLNPPRGADGEVVRPRPAPETTRERCAQCGSAAVRRGATLCGRCAEAPDAILQKPVPDGDGGRGEDDDGGVLPPCRGKVNR